MAVALMAIGGVAIAIVVITRLVISDRAVAILSGNSFISLSGHILSTIGGDAASEMTDQALLDPFHIIRSCVGAAAETRVDAVDDIALSNLVRNDLAASFDSINAARSELHLRQVSRHGYHIGNCQVHPTHGHRPIGRG